MPGELVAATEAGGVMVGPGFWVVELLGSPRLEKLASGLRRSVMAYRRTSHSIRTKRRHDADEDRDHDQPARRPLGKTSMGRGGNMTEKK